MKRRVLSAALALGMSACATTTYVLPPDKPVAHVMLGRGQMAGNQDAHLGWIDPATNKLSFLAPDTGFEYDVAYTIEAETPTILGTDLMTRIPNWDSYCDVYFGFTPKTGHTYHVTTSGRGETECSNTVVDTQTNAPPDDFRPVDLSAKQ